MENFVNDKTNANLGNFIDLSEDPLKVTYAYWNFQTIEIVKNKTSFDFDFSFFYFYVFTSCFVFPITGYNIYIVYAFHPVFSLIYVGLFWYTINAIAFDENTEIKEAFDNWVHLYFEIFLIQFFKKISYSHMEILMCMVACLHFRLVYIKFFNLVLPDQKISEGS